MTIESQTEQLTREEKQRLHVAVAHCPIHKLMTSTNVEIVTESLE